MTVIKWYRDSELPVTETMIGIMENEGYLQNIVHCGTTMEDENELKVEVK